MVKGAAEKHNRREKAETRLQCRTVEEAGRGEGRQTDRVEGTGGVEEGGRKRGGGLISDQVFEMEEGKRPEREKLASEIDGLEGGRQVSAYDVLAWMQTRKRMIKKRQMRSQILAPPPSWLLPQTLGGQAIARGLDQAKNVGEAAGKRPRMDYNEVQVARLLQVRRLLSSSSFSPPATPLRLIAFFPTA